MKHLMPIYIYISLSLFLSLCLFQRNESTGILQSFSRRANCLACFYRSWLSLRASRQLFLSCWAFPNLGTWISINTSFLSLGISGDRMVYAVVLCSLGVPDQDWILLTCNWWSLTVSFLCQVSSAFTFLPRTSHPVISFTWLGRASEM